MSATLNMNQIAYIPWKGKTFNQITSSIQKNKTGDNLSEENYFRARGLNIYRREIANTTTPCNSRTSIKIDELNQPNGYLIYESNNNNNKGLVNTYEIPIPNNTSQLGNSVCNIPFSGNTKTSCMSQESNALRRVRSSGMIKKKYDPITNTTAYFTSSNQYLTSRNRTYPQNQFIYQTAVQPNTCTPIVNPNNTKFKQQGAVSASSLVNRVKFDQITQNAGLYQTPYGTATANALVYNTNSGAYTIKDKIGYPLKRTPKATTTGEMIFCQSSEIP